MHKQGTSDYPSGLLAQFRRNFWLYAAGALLVIGQQLLMATRGFSMRTAVDAAVASKSDEATRAAVLMLGLSVGAAVMRVLSRITVFTGGRNVEYELRAVLLSSLHKLGPAFFRRMPTGEIMSRATNDLQQVRLLLGFGILNIISSVCTFASAVWVMLHMNVRLTLAALMTLPLLMLITRAFSSRLFTRTRDAQEAIGKMSDRVLASLAGVRVVRSFALEEAECATFSAVNDAYVEKNLRLARLRGSMEPIMGSISAIGVLIVFLYGGRMVISREMTEGEFAAFWTELLRLTWPMLALGFVASILQRGRAGYARLKTIFDAQPEVTSGSLPDPGLVRGAISVRGLSFSHGSKQVVRDVSFDVPAGRSLAIVGRTGSGKSTIASLLPRLMPTPPGTVLLDGADVCDLPIATVRASIGYAQQDAFLFSTTVARNIGYSLKDPDSPKSLEIIRAAAREAEVLAEIESLPEGFDTVVGERGVQLSGGQRQRVALARALVREPPILVLDDPLSAVDAKTEASILAAIERQASRRTLILITHRVAAAQRCDSIIVLDAGRIIERGSHDELVRAGGLYAAFAEEQQMEEDLDTLDVDSLPKVSIREAAVA
jgi:ATP-binding cassette subfamily B protein